VLKPIVWHDVFIGLAKLARRTFARPRIDYSLGDVNQGAGPIRRNDGQMRGKTDFARDTRVFTGVQKFFKKVKKRLVSLYFLS
jgi:hypothetical protein